MRTHTTSQEAVEMYLKTVAELSRQQSPVPIARIAERLGVTAVSANEMMKRLAEQAYVNHTPYKGITLTLAGQSIAHSLMRRQRLWECFLVDELKLSWSGVYEAACRLEHATSNVVAEALAAYLNHPQHCPHGNVIPSATGEVHLEESYALSTIPVGKQVSILSIQPTTTDIYAHLQQRGLLPGRGFTVVEAAPLGGPLTLRGQAETITVGLTVAELIDVVVLAANSNVS